MNTTSSTIFHIGLCVFYACATGCKENGQDTKSPSTPETQSVEQRARPDLGDITGEAVRMAAKDSTLPAEIREGAAVFERMLQNEKISQEEFARADWKLHSRRTETTYKIWISLLSVMEARLPNPLPSKEEMDGFEKLVMEKKIDPLHIESLRYMQLLPPSVKALTQFDMPEADIQVEIFMKRFESKYGSSEVGRIYIDVLKIEISQAKEARKLGRVPWKYRLKKEAAEQK